MPRLPPVLSYANVMATIAVFIALGGGAYAALKLPKNSVGTKQLKANAVSSSKVKNRSLLARDFAKGQLPAGTTGAQGPKGDKGDKGDAGTPGTPGQPGARGPSDALVDAPANKTFTAATDIATLTLPPGKWVLSAKTVVVNLDGAGTQNVNCQLVAAGAVTPLDEVAIDLTLSSGSTVTDEHAIALLGSHVATTQTDVALRCSGSFQSTRAEQPKLSAIRVETLNGA